MPNRPRYTIGIISEFVDVHPETIRIWERHGLIGPARRSGKRFYSENDLKRLLFIKKVKEDGLNIPAIKHHLKLYPCWFCRSDQCPNCGDRPKSPNCIKPCWKEDGCCQATNDSETCLKCEFNTNTTTKQISVK